ASRRLAEHTVMGIARRIRTGTKVHLCRRSEGIAVKRLGPSPPHGANLCACRLVIPTSPETQQVGDEPA
ncbi:MAG TPA: hypothetical protein VGI86_04230, partial [Acidimicrobiia bacterium]